MNENKSYLLSASTEKDGETVYIHADLAGLEKLEKTISFLKKKLLEGECDHDHLMSISWGSDELTETMLPQERSDNCSQVHHIKIYSWTDEWKKKHDL